MLMYGRPDLTCYDRVICFRPDKRRHTITIDERFHQANLREVLRSFRANIFLCLQKHYVCNTARRVFEPVSKKNHRMQKLYQEYMVRC